MLQTGFGNEWTVNRRHMAIEKKPNFSEVSWPDLVSTDQCFSRFASFIWVWKWSEETYKKQRTKFSLSFPLSFPLSLSLSLQQGLQLDNWYLSRVANLDVYRGQVSNKNEGTGWDRTKGNVCLYCTSESKPCSHSPPLWTTRNTCAQCAQRRLSACPPPS